MLFRSCLAFHASSVNKLVDVVDFCVMCLDKSVCVRGECVLCKQLYEIVRLCSSNYSWNDVHIFIWSPFKNYFMHEKINMCKCHRCFVWNVTKSPLNIFLLLFRQWQLPTNLTISPWTWLIWFCPLLFAQWRLSLNYRYRCVIMSTGFCKLAHWLWCCIIGR